jgi:hypothetical protein
MVLVAIFHAGRKADDKRVFSLQDPPFHVHGKGIKPIHSKKQVGKSAGSSSQKRN